MKTDLHSDRTGPRSQQGFAVLVVLVLLLMTMALVLSNARVLGQLKGNLDQVEQRQLKQYHPPALVPARTNANRK